MKGGGETMTTKQIEHVEQQLISFIDAVMEKGERATPEEVAALPEIAFSLAKLHEL